MKARIVGGAEEEKILLYGLEEVKKAAVLEAASSLGIAARVVEGREACQSIGWLLGWEGFAPLPPSGPGPAGECLVFALPRRSRLDQLLRALAQAGVSVPLKAMVTPTNRAWPLEKLLEELRQEHRAMTGREV